MHAIARCCWIVVLLAGCRFYLEPPAQYSCSSADPRCPPGLECREGLCVLPSQRDGTVDRPALDHGPIADRGPIADQRREGARCGNAVIEPGEDCEGPNLGGKRCQDLCFGEGVLKCVGCAFSTEDCALPTSWVEVKAKGVGFYLGSLETEIARDKGETRHLVTLTHDVLFSPTEVSQEQFAARIGYNPSRIPANGHPVEEVLWSEAAAYCNELSKKEGLASCYVFEKTECPPDLGMCKTSGDEALCKQTRCTSLKVDPKYLTVPQTIYNCPGYRLPTEAEWELAYRAGTTTSTYAGELTAPGGNDPVAEKIGWYYNNTNNGASHAKLAKKAPNGFCLFDMAGNVWEHCNDVWQDDLGAASVTDPTGPSSGTFRSARGGSHYELARELRAARRVNRHVRLSNVNTGFRCVRTLF